MRADFNPAAGRMNRYLRLQAAARSWRTHERPGAAGVDNTEVVDELNRMQWAARSSAGRPIQHTGP